MSEPFNPELVLIDARHQAEEIVRRAHEQERQLIEETERQAKRLYREMLGLQEKEYRGQQRKIIIDARLDKRKYLARVKEGLVEELLRDFAKETGDEAAAVVAALLFS